MKRAICLFCFAALLTGLCGCDKKYGAFTLAPFTCEVQLVNGEKICEGIFSFEGRERMQLDFLSGEEIEGLKVCYENGGCRYTYDGITVTADTTGFSTPANGIFSAIGLLTDSGGEITDGKYKIIDNGVEYTYNIDIRDNRLTQIESTFGKIVFKYDQ